MNLSHEDISRFWEKVDIYSSDDGCWLWTANKLWNGYGKVTLHQDHVLAHRLSYIIAGGTIPVKHDVRHLCRNRNCVNPEHLETGTRKENMADKVRDGTMVWGDKHHKAKLTTSDILSIRNAISEGEYQTDVAKKFHVSAACINDIVLRRNWKHI